MSLRPLARFASPRLRPLARLVSLRLRPLLRRRSPRLFVWLWSPNDRELGELGEEVAARHLARRGLRILARRLRTRSGEADLVASSGARLVVVEVKTGRSIPFPRPRGSALSQDALLRWRPGVRCDARRLARLRAIGKELCADPFFRRLPFCEPPRHEAQGPRRRAGARVDLVEVFLCERRKHFRVLHHPDLRAPLP